MKKKYEIVVAFLDKSRSVRNLYEDFEETSKPFDTQPSEEEVDEFVQHVAQIHSHPVHERTYRPKIKKAWIREI